MRPRLFQTKVKLRLNFPFWSMHEGMSAVRVEALLNTDSGGCTPDSGRQVEAAIQEHFQPCFKPDALLHEVSEAAPTITYVTTKTLLPTLKTRIAHAKTYAAAHPENSDEDKLMIIGGGDGSLRDAAALLSEHGWSLGVLPMGTINIVARDLCLPLDPVEAVACLAQGVDVPTDLGEINGIPFISHVAVGVHAWVVRHRSLQEKLQKQNRFWAMAKAWLRAFRYAKPLKLLLELDEEAKKIRSPLLIIANNGFSSDSRFLPQRTHLDRGELVVYVVEAETRLRFALMVAAALSGRWSDNPLMKAYSAKKAQITKKGETIRVAMDGDVQRLTLPLTVKSRPQALTLRVPQDWYAKAKSNGHL